LPAKRGLSRRPKGLSWRDHRQLIAYMSLKKKQRRMAVAWGKGGAATAVTEHGTLLGSPGGKPDRATKVPLGETLDLVSCLFSAPRIAISGGLARPQSKHFGPRRARERFPFLGFLDSNTRAVVAGPC
jgi:hypothetical protein